MWQTRQHMPSEEPRAGRPVAQDHTSPLQVTATHNGCASVPTPHLLNGEVPPAGDVEDNACCSLNAAFNQGR